MAFSLVAITGCLDDMTPSPNRNDPRISKKSSYKLNPLSGSAIRLELNPGVRISSSWGRGEGNEAYFQAHVTVMIHNGKLGQNLQLGKHQEKITFIIKACT